MNGGATHYLVSPPAVLPYGSGVAAMQFDPGATLLEQDAVRSTG
jgi:hypothetical protein